MALIRGVRTILSIFTVLTVTLALSALGISLLLARPFPEILAVTLFFGGILLMVITGFAGPGFDESRLHGYLLTPKVELTPEERAQGRQEVYRVMIVGLLLGLGLIGLSVLFFQWPL